MPSNTSNRVLIDHDEIRKWIEERGGQPARVRQTGNEAEGDPGVLRIDFPGYSGEDTLEPVSWDEFSRKLDESGLALLVQDRTASGQRSNFNKIVSSETAQEILEQQMSSAGVRSSQPAKSSTRSSGTASRSQATRSSGRSAAKKSSSRSSKSAGSPASKSASMKKSSGQASKKKAATAQSRSATGKAKRGTSSRSTTARKAGASVRSISSGRSSRSTSTKSKRSQGGGRKAA